jgi:non-lysosomal glucosylceramidase
LIYAYKLISSAYCGGLHIAALRACVEMARILNDDNAIEEYEAWLILAKKSYSEKLWNGKYYNYDSSRSSHHDSIMSDQLAGFWYLRLCGHEYDVGLIQYFPFIYLFFCCC